MIEDDSYRSSTQFRYWNYTPSQRATLRQTTNELAAEKVRAAFRRPRQAQQSQNGRKHDQDDETTNDHVEGETRGTEDEGGDDDDDDDEVDIQTLSVDEELKIIEWGCNKIIDMGEATKPRIPTSVVATAIQFLRRFYLTNSPMTYHPRDLTLCCLYLATKTDHFFIPLHKFIADLDVPNLREEDVKAPEFLLLQGLRFTLEVRHPMRGLQGGVVEMMALVKQGRLGRGFEGKEGEKRVGGAADRAKRLLAREAQLTDAYFLWTPSQIWLAGLSCVDAELVQRYVAVRFEELGQRGEAGLRQKVLERVKECAVVLMVYKSPEDDKATRQEMKRIGGKLKMCQNPEKVDIVAVAKAKAAEKREGSESEVELKKKKRKLEREKMARDGEVFGGGLTRDA